MSDFWRARCADADVPKIRLHDARLTCGTLMHMQGVPTVVIAQWLGHADPAFTMRTYVHSQGDALKIAAASLQQVVHPRDIGERRPNGDSVRLNMFRQLERVQR